MFSQLWFLDLQDEEILARRRGKPLITMHVDDTWEAQNQRATMLWFEHLQPAEPNKIASVRRRSLQSVMPTAKGTKSSLKKAATKEWELFDLSAHPDWPPTAKGAATQW